MPEARELDENEQMDIEADALEAAKKRQEIMEENRLKSRAERKRKEKESGLVFKANEYDSDEAEFEKRMDKEE